MNEVSNVGVNPTGSALTRDERKLYVCNSNNYALPNEDTVTSINLISKEIVTIHGDFIQPYRCAIATTGDEKEEYVYITNSNSPKVAGTLGFITIVSVTSDEIQGYIRSADLDGPGDIVVSPRSAYVTNYGADGGVKSGNGRSVAVINLKQQKVSGVIETAQGPAALALHPNLKFLYVACYIDGNPGTGVLQTVNLKSKQVVSTISGFSGPFDVVNRGRYCFITNFGSNNFSPVGHTVMKVDVIEGTIVGTVETGIQPSGIALSSDEKLLFVTNYNALYAHANFQDLTYGQGTVSVIDSRSFKVISTHRTGRGPNKVTVGKNNTIYVTQYPDNTVNIIKI